MEIAAEYPFRLYPHEVEKYQSLAKAQGKVLEIKGQVCAGRLVYVQALPDPEAPPCTIGSIMAWYKAQGINALIYHLYKDVSAQRGGHQYALIFSDHPDDRYYITTPADALDAYQHWCARWEE